MGACFGVSAPSKNANKQAIIHTTHVSQPRHNSIWENQYAMGMNSLTDTDITANRDQTWESQNLYDVSKSNIVSTPLKQQPIDGVFPDRLGTDLPIKSKDSTNYSNASTNYSEFDDISCIPPGQPTGDDIVTPLHSETNIDCAGGTDSSYFSKYTDNVVADMENGLAKRKTDEFIVKTRSGRWGSIVADHVGVDGIRQRQMIKAIDGSYKPEFRKANSFEPRRTSSFLEAIVVQTGV